MGYYLDDHPNPNCPQQRCPRRAAISGVIGIHTTEGVADKVLPDMGAENTASYISVRDSYGSYHRIIDSDTVVEMAGDGCETWHIAESDNFGYGMNSHSFGLSIAARTTDLYPEDPFTYLAIDKMGKEAVAFWQRNGFNVSEVNRWLTRDEAKNRVPGLVHHGVVQPSDRSDAWVNNPHKAALDQMLIDAINRYAGLGQPTPDPEPEISVSAEENILNAVKDDKDTNAQWHKDTRKYSQSPRSVLGATGNEQYYVAATSEGLRRFHIKDQAQLSLLIRAGVIADLPPTKLNDAETTALMEIPAS